MAEVNADGARGVWKRDSTRDAILDAARKLAGREGLEAVTLSRVANEAGFAPPTVYAHFVNKEDLHLAVVADDLATLARAMQKDSGVAKQPDTEKGPPSSGYASDVVAPHPAIASDQVEPSTAERSEADEIADMAEDVQISLFEIGQALGVIAAGDDYDNIVASVSEGGEDIPEAFPEDAADGPADSAEISSQTARPATVEEMAAEIIRLRQTVARLEARPVDAWLERRLRVFERALADIEARMETCERDSSTAVYSVQESFAALEQRTTNGEEHHLSVAADLQTYIRDLSGRLNAAENSLSRLLGGAGPASHVLAEVVADAREPSYDKMLSVPSAENSDEQKAEAGDFLAAARHAARSAAAMADGKRTTGPLHYLNFGIAPIAASKVAFSRRKLEAVATALALVVVLIAAVIVLQGRSTASSRPAVPVQNAVSADARVAALAKAGNPKAELVAALKLMNGDGVTADLPSAAYWLKRAALQHQPVAQYWLGTLYERGHGVAKDRAQAMQWYQQAAEAGNTKAMYRLAVGYSEGWGGGISYTDAAKWFAKAANLGVVDAQFNLAVLYERGTGVPQSRVNAFKWYTIAVAQGDAESRAQARVLSAQLPHDDVAAARAAAAKFQATRPDPAANDAPDVADVAAGR